MKILILLFFICGSTSHMYLNGYDNTFKLIQRSNVICDDNTCLNSYDMIMNLTNASYVCFIFEDNDCWLYDIKEDGAYRSFGVTYSPIDDKFTILTQTEYYSKSFARSVVMQCMFYDEFTNGKAFCLTNVP